MCTPRTKRSGISILFQIPSCTGRISFKDAIQVKAMHDPRNKKYVKR